MHGDVRNVFFLQWEKCENCHGLLRAAYIFSELAIDLE